MMSIDATRAMMRTSRTALITFTMAALAGVGWLISIFLRSGVLEHQLVDAIAEISHERLPRPTHVSHVTPGTFGDVLTPHMATLIATYRKLRDAPEVSSGLVRAVLWRSRALEDLPPAWWQALDDSRRSLNGALSASHAAYAQAPEGLRILNDVNHPFYEEGHISFAYMATLTAVDILQSLGTGQVDAAVDECVDAFAFGRDLAYNGLTGQLAGALIQGMVFPACAAALDRVPAHEKERAAQQLGVIRDATPTMSWIMRQERTAQAARLFGGLIRPALIGRLPGELRSLIWQQSNRGGHSSLGELWSSLRERQLWLRFVGAHERMARVWDGPRGQRDHVYEEVFADLRHSWRGSNYVSRYLKDDDRRRGAIARLEVLRAAVYVDLFRTRHGRWPKDLAEALPPDLKLIDPRTGQPVTLAPSGDTVQAICETPCGEDSSAIRLTLHPDGP